MKKVLTLFLVIALVLGTVVGFTSCGRGGDADGLVVYLISHSPPPDSTLDDGSFNQGSMDGIRLFVNAHGGSYHFMQPHAGNDEARLDIFRDAIDAGANVLVLPGFHFQHVVNDAQRMWPDVYFILIDTQPSGGPPASNLVGILYAEQESGFLAGYAAVREGYTQLGFMGGNPVPAVVRFGLGFLRGAEHAAQAMGLSPGDVEVNYHFLGGFGASPEITAAAASWYAGGTEVIFVAAGAAGFSVAEAANAANTWMIGVDVDQYHISPRVLTSAMKALDVSIYDMLVDIQAGNFRGGNVLMYDATNNGVALPMANSHFRNFTQAQYNAIFNQIAGGTIVVPGLTTPLADAADQARELANVVSQLNIVRVNEI